MHGFHHQPKASAHTAATSSTTLTWASDYVTQQRTFPAFLPAFRVTNLPGPGSIMRSDPEHDSGRMDKDGGQAGAQATPQTTWATYIFLHCDIFEPCPPLRIIDSTVHAVKHNAHTSLRPPTGSMPVRPASAPVRPNTLREYHVRLEQLTFPSSVVTLPIVFRICLQHVV